MRLFEFAQPDSGTFVAAKFSEKTISDITGYQEKYAIPDAVSGDDLHTTIVYSRVPIIWECEDNLNVKASPKALNVWTTRSGTKCLVLEIESDFLQERFDDAIDLGATHDFDDYKAHITLSYNVGDFDVSVLVLPTFPITITREYREALDDKDDDA